MVQHLRHRDGKSSLKFAGTLVTLVRIVTLARGGKNQIAKDCLL